MYEGKTHSSVTEVFLAPSFVEGGEEDPDIILEDDGVEIRIVFRAKPWPQEEELSWSINDAEGNLIQVENYTEQGHFLVNEITEVGDDEYTLESVLKVFDLKEDKTIFLSIQNEVGSVDKTFNIIVPTTTTTTTTTTSTTTMTTEENITALPVILGPEDNKYVVEDSSTAAIIAIVIGVLFGVALILLGFVCYNKKSDNLQPGREGGRSNGNSGYFPVDNGLRPKVGRIVVSVKLCGFDII